VGAAERGRTTPGPGMRSADLIERRPRSRVYCSMTSMQAVDIGPVTFQWKPWVLA